MHDLMHGIICTFRLVEAHRQPLLKVRTDYLWRAELTRKMTRS